MTMPFAPAPLSVPVVNPSIGGYGQTFDYLSTSDFSFDPNAIDTSNLVDGGDAQAQTVALAMKISRASRWADRICFGADAAGKGASLCATQSVQQDWVPLLMGELRLICDYKPIIELDGLEIGYDSSSVAAPSSTSGIRIGGKVIHVPMQLASVNVGGLSDTFTEPGRQYGRRYVVWSYVNGYPHTLLAATATAGTKTVVCRPTTPSGGLYGVYPGTQLSIPDGANSEPITVSSVSGATITTVAPLVNTHLVPTLPDFRTVTAMPLDVIQAVILLAVSLIKTRGDNSLVLEGITEPTKAQSTYAEGNDDMINGMAMLDDFRVATKARMG